LSEKQDAEAVRLSVASNLICRMTAFIAWDEVEKVAVSRHELVQPAMAPAGRGAAAYDRFMPGAEMIGRSAMPRLRDSERGSYLGATSSAESPLEIVRMEAGQELTAICQRIPGSDWQAPYQALIKWLHQAGTAEFAGTHPQLQRLLLKLKLCVDLIVALNSDENSVVKQLRRWQDRFEMLSQRQESDGNRAELEAVFRAVESFNPSISPRQLPILKTKAQFAAVELLEQFTIHLPALNGQQRGRPA
jgi:hypothetical protein